MNYEPSTKFYTAPLCGEPPPSAYDRVQDAIGHPLTEHLQVHGSISALESAVSYHVEMVAALLRRIQPVTGELGESGESEAPTPQKVDIAESLDAIHYRIRITTASLLSAIQNLQI